MIVRWVSAAVLEAGRRFRRVRGYRDLSKLVQALETIEAKEINATGQQVAQ